MNLILECIGRACRQPNSISMKNFGHKDRTTKQRTKRTVLCANISHKRMSKHLSCVGCDRITQVHTSPNNKQIHIKQWFSYRCTSDDNDNSTSTLDISFDPHLLARSPTLHFSPISNCQMPNKKTLANKVINSSIMNPKRLYVVNEK